MQGRCPAHCNIEKIQEKRQKLMNPFEFFIPQNITVGAGTLAKLPECARKLGGSHAMLISGPTLRDYSYWQ